MRKTVLTLIMVATIIASYGQGIWKDSKFFVDFGPKIAIGPSWFNNDASSFYDTTDNTYLYKFGSNRFNWGGKFAFDFNNNLAIVVEYLQTTNTQNFGVDGSKLKIKSKGTEIPLMFRFNRDNDIYYEAGMVFVNTKSVTESIDGFAETNYTELYNIKRTGLVFGAGQYSFGVGNWGVSTGFRFRYNFDDLISDKTPIMESSPIYANDGRAGFTKDMTIMLVMEFNYDLGFTMAKSGCGRSRKFMFTSGRR